jgi:hypothetical protein
VEKPELNAVLAKENTRITIRVKTRVFYAMKTQRVSLPHKNARIQPYATENKHKRKLKKNKDAPRTTHSI